MQHIVLQPAFIYGLVAGIILMFAVSQLTAWKAAFHPKPQTLPPPLLNAYGPSRLDKENADLKKEREQLTARVNELQATAPPQLEIVTYQQAADWLRMVNTIT
jgi:cell division protein FtsB